jgi:hypothetical protein
VSALPQASLEREIRVQRRGKDDGVLGLVCICANTLGRFQIGLTLKFSWAAAVATGNSPRRRPARLGWLGSHGKAAAVVTKWKMARPPVPTHNARAHFILAF